MGETLPAGTVLWLKARTNATVTVVGPYSAPTNIYLSAGGTFVPSPSLEAWSIPNALPTNAVSWRYDPQEHRWQASFGDALRSVLDLPRFISPGDAFYVQTTTSVDLELPDPALSQRFYHHDHLSSSSCLTDARGALVEETANYPFGYPRHQYQLKSIHEPYQFIQKERDAESGLDYFEARYLAATLGRFSVTDNLAQRPPFEWLVSPSRSNPYAWSHNRPLTFFDPNGRFAIYAETEGTGHVGVQVKDGKAVHNYDFGRYRGSYDKALYAGPNILKRTEGKPRSSKFEGFQQFNFNVSKELDAKIASTFQEKFRSGEKSLAKEILDQMKGKSQLGQNERYMKSDWGLLGPNCVVFSLGTLKEALQSVIDNRGDEKLVQEATSVLSEIQKLQGITPGTVKEQLKDLPRFNGGREPDLLLMPAL
jgi:RHS repeat-associated protein